jgi:Flp pilus assembly protein protease CpaA
MTAVALIAVFIAFSVCLLAIAGFDLRTASIPNTVSAVLLWLFVVSLPLGTQSIDLLSHVLSFCAAIPVGVLAFRFGGFGGGDVKSWVSVAIWYDLGALPYQVLAVSLIAGLFGLLMMGLRRLFVNYDVRERRQDRRMPRLLRAGHPIPYGVAIALGSALTIGKIPLFASLLSDVILFG